MKLPTISSAPVADMAGLQEGNGLFRSFWMAGYEGADHLNSRGHPLSMNEANGHWQKLDEDYALLAGFGIRTVRESIGWRLTEAHGDEGFERLARHSLLAERHGIQVIWTLMHYGWPADIDLLSPAFIDRFGAFSERVARTLAAQPGAARVYQPINEISFLSWALSGTALIRHPMNTALLANSHAVKCQLVRAALRACEAIGRVDVGARFLHTDPLIYVAPPVGANAEQQAAAQRETNYSFEAWDMLAGLAEPGLGGSPQCLDMVGLNYYHSNQWEQGTDMPLPWHKGDPRRKPLSELVQTVWNRLQRPMVLAETSHVGDGRSQWIEEVAREAAVCRQRGLPLEGICLYPIVDRQGWDETDRWHKSGLWDVGKPQVTAHAPDPFERALSLPYAERLRHWQQCLPANQAFSTINNSGESAMLTLIVFSHLRWNFVYQRPQHLLSRLAQHYRVVFVEEPMPNAPNDFMERLTPAEHVDVLRPHVMGSAQGFHDDHLPVLQAQLAAFLQERGVDDYLVWFYTPMALPLASELRPRAVVYDCMDELSAFKHAPRQLIQRENALYQTADLVLTGGPSLFRSKRERHGNVHCFPSSVDAAHFVPRAGVTDHPAQASLPHPRLGYCGVIDERVDLDLIAALADADPAWQIVMVGPVAKINPDTLPRRSNIHWLGQQGYEDLPRFMAGWDVCLLPFALNDSTRFISPTKTLEYMAAGRPSVSTRIRDVAEPYGHVVTIADTAPEFIQACRSLLADAPAAREARAGQMQAIVDNTSWDATVEAIHALMQALPVRAVATQNAALTEIAGNAANPAISSTASHAMQHKPVVQVAQDRVYSTVVLGAGPTGLSAAHHLGEGSLLLEKSATVGGWCRSIVDKGFTFDCAGHIMFSNDPYVLQLYEKLLGANMHWQNREAWIYSKEVYTRYPFQGALYGLPADVLKECLMGAIEARYGSARNESSGPSGNIAAPAANEPGVAVGSKAGAVASIAKTQEPKNFEEFIYKVWGTGVAKHFAIPYNKKLWAVPLTEMETSWLGGRVPMPNLEEMIEGALSPVTKPMGPNARFGYPLKGGFQALMDGFLPLLRGDVELEAEVATVSPARRTVTLKDGRSYRYETLISTLPLPKLVDAMGEEAPEFVKAAARGLRHVSVRCVNLGIGREALTDKHWIYYPEETIFHRIFVQGNASPHCNAPGGFGFTCEITYSQYKPLPCDGQALIDRCISDCIKVGMINADDPIVAANQVDMPYAYVVYDHDRAKHVEAIRQWMAGSNIVLAGRYSEWEYYNSDHAFVAGKRAAGEAQAINGVGVDAPVAALKPAA